jgi:hypothetical protein
MLTEDLLKKPNFLQMILGWLEHVPGVVRPPSPGQLEMNNTRGSTLNFSLIDLRFTQRIETNFWGKVGCLVDNI